MRCGLDWIAPLPNSMHLHHWLFPGLFFQALLQGWSWDHCLVADVKPAVGPADKTVGRETEGGPAMYGSSSLQVDREEDTCQFPARNKSSLETHLKRRATLIATTAARRPPRASSTDDRHPMLRRQFNFTGDNNRCTATSVLTGPSTRSQLTSRRNGDTWAIHCRLTTNLH